MIVSTDAEDTVEILITPLLARSLIPVHPVPSISVEYLCRIPAQRQSKSELQGEGAPLVQDSYFIL